MALFNSLPPDRQTAEIALECAWLTQSTWLPWDNGKELMAKYGGPQTFAQYFRAIRSDIRRFARGLETCQAS